MLANKENVLINGKLYLYIKNVSIDPKKHSIYEGLSKCSQTNVMKSILIKICLYELFYDTFRCISILYLICFSQKLVRRLLDDHGR